MKTQRTLLVDKEKCIGCYACVVACKAEHSSPPHPTNPVDGNPEGPDLIRITRIGPEVHGDELIQYFLAVVCRHCTDGPCISSCPFSAIYKDTETGVTLVDEDKCVGCKACLKACPYGAPQFHNGKMKLCNLCLHRLKEGRQYTACEAVCQARAICVVPAGEISTG